MIELLLFLLFVIWSWLEDYGSHIVLKMWNTAQESVDEHNHFYGVFSKVTAFTDEWCNGCVDGSSSGEEE
jgi:hypothetical protein